VDRLLDEANLMLPQPSHVAMATKFDTKLAITWLVREISLRSLNRISNDGGNSSSSSSSSVSITSVGADMHSHKCLLFLLF